MNCELKHFNFHQSLIRTTDNVFLFTDNANEYEQYQNEKDFCESMLFNLGNDFVFIKTVKRFGLDFEKSHIKSIRRSQAGRSEMFC